MEKYTEKRKGGNNLSYIFFGDNTDSFKRAIEKCLLVVLQYIGLRCSSMRSLDRIKPRQDGMMLSMQHAERLHVADGSKRLARSLQFGTSAVAGIARTRMKVRIFICLYF